MAIEIRSEERGDPPKENRERTTTNTFFYICYNKSILDIKDQDKIKLTSIIDLRYNVNKARILLIIDLKYKGTKARLPLIID